MADEPDLKLPYSQQLSPSQTPLNKLLAILRENAGKPSLLKAIASAFFKAKTGPDKLARNTIIALRSYGILGEDDRLTTFGRELLAYQGDEQGSHRMLAKHILLELNGVSLVEALREMTEGRYKIELITITAELAQRGFKLNKNSSDLSSVLGWFRAAGVLKDQYILDPEVYRELVGVSVATLNVTRALNREQVAFLHALLALNIKEWEPYNSVVRHAEDLYAGEVTYNWKDIVATILQPLQKAGLIEFRKHIKIDKSTPEGRGGKTAQVKPTPLFEKEFAEPLLASMFRGAIHIDAREIRRKSLQDIVADIKQTADPNKSGLALEMLAVRLCQMLGLEFVKLREKDVQATGGGEVDAFMHSARLVYSRWQVQCKIGPITFEAVAKENGMLPITLANVILIVSTGKPTASAVEFRTRLVSTTNLNLIFIDGTALEKIIKDHSALVEILRQQAREALSLKPWFSARTSTDPSKKNSRNPEITLTEDSVEYGGPNKVVAKLPKPAHHTALGATYCGDALSLLPALIAEGYRAKLIITSPPFALVRKKEYGNEDSDTYLDWFTQFIPLFKNILEPRGSLVIDIGGTWIRGLPARSIYQFKLLLRLCESGFYLAQDFYHYNPARLPTPAEWVTIRRLRVKDSINNVWWLTQDPFVEADNRQVLSPYSESMKSLIEKGYKPAMRPSGHDISHKFGKDNGGAIPPNLLEFANTESNSHYLRRCKETGVKAHPARFPQALPEFFIKFLTRPGDLIYDPFAGSNVSGAAAESLRRRWIATELSPSYIEGSAFRFEPEAAANGTGTKTETPKGPPKRSEELSLF